MNPAERLKEVAKRVWGADVTPEGAEQLIEKHKNDLYPILRSYETQSKYWRHILFGEQDKRAFQELKRILHGK